ncbi:MAG: sensor histidine kinase [Dehalococcoidales bacterium]|nr:sensor histidine kinase [Dehalococcoidales bacterium]
MVRVDNSTLDVDKVIPCALIVNELVSNSLKYAFPARRNGGTAEIRVNLRSDGENRFILTVSDNGIGLPESFNIENCPTLGLKLVNVLTKQLGGSLSISREGGTKFTIAFSGGITK